MARQPLTRLKLVPQAQASKALEMFLLDCRARRLSLRTVDFYRQQLQYATGYFREHGADTLEAISPSLIRGYLVHRQEQNLSDNTVHAAARSLRAWLNWCVSEDLIQSSPMKNVRMPRRDKRILPALEAQDVARLLEAAKDSVRDTAIILTLLDTGLRAAEFVALNVADVATTTGAIQVLAGKGGKDRVVYLGSQSRKAVRKYILTHDPYLDVPAPLWRSETTGERLTQDGLRQLLTRIGRRAKVDNAHPHTFRRTFALWSLRSGMNVYALQRLMGHSDLSILKQYLALVETDIEQAHREHGAVDSMLRKRGK